MINSPSVSIPDSASLATKAASAGGSKIRHAGAPRARAHHVDTGARTEEQRERVHDDGFAAPRLSGEEIQARLEREAKAVHHCVALYIEFLQHAAKRFGDDARRTRFAPEAVQSA